MKLFRDDIMIGINMTQEKKIAIEANLKKFEQLQKNVSFLRMMIYALDLSFPRNTYQKFNM